jgi:hypothetical protein
LPECGGKRFEMRLDTLLKEDLGLLVGGVGKRCKRRRGMVFDDVCGFERDVSRKTTVR